MYYRTEKSKIRGNQDDSIQNFTVLRILMKMSSVKKYMAWNTRRRRLIWSRKGMGHFH
jgi:hypothetical protein